MSFSKKGNKFSPFVVFDIGNANVGAALVVFDEDNDKVNILCEIRVNITFQDSLDKRRLFTDMVLAIKKAGEYLQKKSIGKPTDDAIKMKDIKNVFCVLSSPWYKAQVKTLKFEEEKPFIIYSKNILKILNQKNEDFIEKNNKLIEKKIIQILLNGYNTNNPYGKEATKIDVTLFTSAIYNNVQEKIKDTLEAIFTSGNVFFHTFALTSFSIVRDMFKTEKNFLLIDISGEITDIMLVREETIKKMGSFSMGKNSLIRKITSSLNTISMEAYSLMRLFFDEKSKKSKSLNVEKALKEVKEEWLSHFRKILSEFSDGISVPKTVFITADTDVSKWFIDIIKNDEFSSYTLTEEPFTVIEISSRILNEYCVAPEKNQKGCDPFLALDAMFVHKIAKD